MPKKQPTLEEIENAVEWAADLAEQAFKRAAGLLAKHHPDLVRDEKSARNLISAGAKINKQRQTERTIKRSGGCNQ